MDTESRPAMMKLTEVAAELKISRATAYRWSREGRLPTVSLGPRGLRVPRAALDAALQVWAEEAIDNLTGDGGTDG